MQYLKYIGCVLLILLISCRGKIKEEGEGEVATVTPVTVTSATSGTLADSVVLNAVSSFLLKTNIKSTINGYLQEVNVKPGDKVNKGQVLFLVRSKEAKSLGNALTNIDTSFHFSGASNIKSPVNGYITQLNVQKEDYVQEGEVLATVGDINSMVFLLDLPYELKPLLSLNPHVKLILSDGEKIAGTISSSMPFVDPVSQTQSYVIRMDEYRSIPENLIAKVAFVRKIKQNAITLPKQAVLANEQQTQFWIMKMTDSTTAVKVPVEKGIETTDRVEILTPVLKPDDKILLTGNYGLPDTAKVVIEK